jgi:hypothetical protein
MSLDRSVAPLRLRMVAGLIDVVVGSAIAGGVGWLALLCAAPAGEREARMTAFCADPRVVQAIQFGTPVAEVLAYRLTSPGSRIVGMRRVDARTGGSPSLRSAVVRSGLHAALTLGLHRLNRPHRERLLRHSAELKARLATVAAEFPDDPEARDRVGAEIGRRGMRGCATAILPSFALGLMQPLTALLSPRRQTVIDRLAGVAFARVPRSR